MTAFPSSAAGVVPRPSSAKPASPAHLYLAGVGAVGGALLNQLAAVQARTGLRLVGACTSRRACWQPSGLAPDAVTGALATGDALDWPAVLRRLVRQAPRPLIFVDATGHPEVARLYERLFQAGIHVVTASKLANTKAQADFDRLLRIAGARGVQYRYETTVGAGLPVVQTVRDLVETGDRICSIRGGVSGTVTFLFGAIRRGASFSEAVRAAIERGYAEPDVRDDLSGEDVARKFIILARAAGFAVERADVQVESLVPAALRSVPREEVHDRFEAADAGWQQRSTHAQQDGATLQYVGTFADGAIRVGVQCLPADAPLGQLQGQENLFEITTRRYAEVPLIIRGPGAGPAVTAAGVLADVLKVARAVTGSSG